MRGALSLSAGWVTVGPYSHTNAGGGRGTGWCTVHKRRGREHTEGGTAVWEAGRVRARVGFVYSHNQRLQANLRKKTNSQTRLRVIHTETHNTQHYRRVCALVFFANRERESYDMQRVARVLLAPRCAVVAPLSRSFAAAAASSTPNVQVRGVCVVAEGGGCGVTRPQNTPRRLQISDRVVRT